MNLSVIAVLAGLASGLTAPAEVPRLTVAPGVEAPPPEVHRVSLPEGKLQGVGIADDMAVFIDLDRTQPRRGDLVEAWMLVVLKPAVRIDGSSYDMVETVARSEFNCRDRTHRDLGVTGFDEEGRLVLWLAEEKTARPDVPDSTMDMISAVVCRGEPAKGPVFTGHKAALEGGRRDIGRI